MFFIISYDVSVIFFSLSHPVKSQLRTQYEQHPVQHHLLQVCSGYQHNSCGFPLPIQCPLYSGSDNELPRCMDLLQYPKHLNISGLPKKCGKTPRLLLCRFSLRSEIRKQQQQQKQHYNNKVKICSTTGGG